MVIVGTGPELESEEFDRVGMDLPRRQSDLIARVAEACSGRTIVIVNTGSPIDTRPWIDSVDAVIQARFPGMELGNALGKGCTAAAHPRRWARDKQKHDSQHAKRVMTTATSPLLENTYATHLVDLRLLALMDGRQRL